MEREGKRERGRAPVDLIFHSSISFSLGHSDVYLTLSPHFSHSLFNESLSIKQFHASNQKSVNRERERERERKLMHLNASKTGSDSLSLPNFFVLNGKLLEGDKRKRVSEIEEWNSHYNNNYADAVGIL